MEEKGAMRLVVFIGAVDLAALIAVIGAIIC